jgi:hypothetical protein
MSRRRKLVVALQAVVLAGAALFLFFSGPPGAGPASERELTLGESGSIVRGAEGEVLDLALGADPSDWVFSRDGRSVIVRPVRYASMPVVCNDTLDRMPVTGRSGDEPALQPCPLPGAETTSIQSLRIALREPGVTTIKGWRVQPGMARPAGLPSTPPDFYYVILVER